MSQFIDYLSRPPAQACFCPSTFKVISGKQGTEMGWALHCISKGGFCNSIKNPQLRCSILSWRCDVLGVPVEIFQTADLSSCFKCGNASLQAHSEPPFLFSNPRATAYFIPHVVKNEKHSSVTHLPLTVFQRFQ